MPLTRAKRRRLAQVARQQAREDRSQRRACGACGENSHLCLPCRCGGSQHKVCVVCLADGYGSFYADGYNYPHGVPTYPLDCYWSTPQTGRPDNTSRLRSGRIWYHRFWVIIINNHGRKIIHWRAIGILGILGSSSCRNIKDNSRRHIVMKRMS